MPQAAVEIWLVRHGETEWSRTGRHTGRTDVPLTPLGERQAAALRDRLASRAFALVLASPLRRAWDTCRCAGLGEVARRCDDLVEWDYGRYEGRTAAEIVERAPGWRIWEDGVPGGEPLEQVGARARQVIDQAVGAPGPVALFSHGHLLRVLAACWLGLDPRLGRGLAIDTASIGVLGQEGGTRLIRAWNWTPEPP